MAQKFALLIGVSEYGEGFEALSAPPKDVAAMQRVLANPELGGFDSANVKTLINPNQTEMQTAIFRLFNGSTKDDLILLFFSGHGITNDDNHLYFCTRQTSKAEYPATAVPASYIQTLSNNLNYAKRQVMILDCCYSGAFAEGWQRKGDVKVELAQELGKEGRVVLTSSSATQVSWQQEEADLSLYTQYLVEGLEEGGADEDGDGLVKVRELHGYAKRKVKEVKPKMKPDIIIGDDEAFDIVVSRVKVDGAALFRRMVEDKVNHKLGKIRSRRAEELLQKRATELGLSSGEVTTIIESVLAPFKRKLKSLERYRQEYLDETENEYPLSADTLSDLQEWQQEVLGLEDSDVASIQTEINHQMEAQYCQPDPELPSSPEVTPENDLQEVVITEVVEPDLKSPKTDTTASLKLGQEDSTTTSVSESSSPQLTRQPLQPQTVSFETALIEMIPKKVQKTYKEGGVFGFGAQEKTREETIYDPRINRQTLTAECLIEPLGNGVTLAMVNIPAGKFMMGSPTGEANRDEDEGPRHSVTIESFWMGKYAVTQAQYQAVMGENPSTKYDTDRFVAPDKPVVGVSWDDAVAFCKKLSEQTDNLYRLPSEAEWEYACRAGTDTPFYFGETLTPDLANYDGKYTYGSGPKGQYRSKPMPVGRFPANKFGLFDMHGNVCEWCQDPWHDNYQNAPTDGSAWETSGDNTRRLLRGGSWYNIPWYCRSAFRLRSFADDWDYDVGFRVVCSPPRTL